ncbi:MAG TPA: hypothetical protein VFT55_16715 [Planctomycetota bacterium]|nr:hypothetical protein [Planctomycetota bacterium]
MRSCFLAFSLLVIGGCATTDPPRILVQVLQPGKDEFDHDAWSAPLDRHPRLQSARLGGAVVQGSWTVRYELDAQDAAWLEGLCREHGQCRLTWDGLVLNGGRRGYIMHLPSKDRAEQVLAQPPWNAVNPDRWR